MMPDGIYFSVVFFFQAASEQSSVLQAYPLDLVRTRLAAQTTSTYYTGIWHALSTIVKDEGLFGLYRGLGATLTQVAPSLAINYCAYETLRSYWLAHEPGRQSPTVSCTIRNGFAGRLHGAFKLDAWNDMHVELFECYTKLCIDFYALLSTVQSSSCPAKNVYTPLIPSPCLSENWTSTICSHCTKQCSVAAFSLCHCGCTKAISKLHIAGHPAHHSMRY